MREILVPWDSQPQEAAEVDWSNPLLPDPSGNKATIWTPQGLFGGARGTLDVGTPGIVRTFNGTSQSELAFQSGDFIAAVGVTAFVWLNTTSATSGGFGIPIGGRSNSGGQTPLNFAWRHTNSSFATAWANHSGSGWTPIKYTSVATNTWMLLSASVRTGANQFAIYRDGSQQATGTVSGFASGLGSGVRVGSNVNSGNNASSFFEGIIAFAGYLNTYWTAEQHASFAANPWQLFAPRTQYIPTASGVLVPTLSLSTFVPGSLTASGWRPQVTTV